MAKFLGRSRDPIAELGLKQVDIRLLITQKVNGGQELTMHFCK